MLCVIVVNRNLKFENWLLLRGIQTLCVRIILRNVYIVFFVRTCYVRLLNADCPIAKAMSECVYYIVDRCSTMMIVAFSWSELFPKLCRRHNTRTKSQVAGDFGLDANTTTTTLYTRLNGRGKLNKNCRERAASFLGFDSVSECGLRVGCTSVVDPQPPRWNGVDKTIG